MIKNPENNHCDKDFNLVENDHQFANKTSKRAMNSVSEQETKKAKNYSIIIMQKASASKQEKQNAILRYETYISELQHISQNFDEQDKSKLQSKLFKLTNKFNEIHSLSEQYIKLTQERFSDLTKEKELLEEHSEDLNEQNKQSIEELDEIEDTLNIAKENLNLKQKELNDYRDHAIQQRLARSREHAYETTLYIYALFITNFYTLLFSTYGFEYSINSHFLFIYYLFESIINVFLTTTHLLINIIDFVLGNLIKT